LRARGLQRLYLLRHFLFPFFFGICIAPHLGARALQPLLQAELRYFSTNEKRNDRKR
jgi:hypothetical protein